MSPANDRVPFGLSKGNGPMPSVISALSSAIHETKLTTDTIDVREILTITESRSSLWKYASVDASGARYWAELPANADKVAACLRHLSPFSPLKCRSSDWDARTRWCNSDGSHHMAALIWHMRRTGGACFLPAVQWRHVRDIAALSRLDAAYALYAVAEAAVTPIVTTCAAAGLAVDKGELVGVVLNQRAIDEHNGIGEPVASSLYLVGFPCSGSPLDLAATVWLTSMEWEGRAVRLIRHIAELPVVAGASG